jgi:hypothetical protein
MSAVAKQSTAVPRIAFRVGEAAEALGVSTDYFTRHVAPELRWVRRSAVKLVARTELEAWMDREASRILDEIEP